MKVVADWIREMTPSWTDEQRYTFVSAVHSWGPPILLFAFVFTENVVLRFWVLCFEVLTLGSEFILRDCMITMVEREFSDSHWDDLFAKTLKAYGYEITRPEKMMFNIGLNLGILLLMILILLRQSVLWVMGIAFSTLPSLALLSSVLRPPQIDVLRLPELQTL